MEQDRRARYMELVSVDGCDAIARVDCRVHGYNAKTYVKDNGLTYYVAVNTWLHIIKQYTQDGWHDVLNLLVRDGLIDTVATFSAEADALVHGAPLRSNAVRVILSLVDVSSAPQRVSVLGYRPNKLAIQLQICRFLKRITLRGRGDCEAAALSSFTHTQEWLGIQAEFGVDTDLLADARDVLSNALPWDELCSKLEAMGPQSRTFTPGAAADAGITLGKKLIVMSQSNPGFFRPIMGTWLGNAPSQNQDPQWLDDADAIALWRVRPTETCRRHAHCVKVSTAPKSLKGPRIIAMEPVNLQMAQRYAKDILYHYLPAGCYLLDQEVNRELAAEGARTGNMATLDLHSASDYVTKQLVWELFPHRFYEAVGWMVPSHYRIGKKSGLLHSFATMGNGLTFWVESVTFWAIASAITGPGNAFVYGDDIIVPTRDAPAVVQLLRRLGFVVNEDKSFLDGDYRESCGFEAMGQDTTVSTYYPRFPIKGEITDHTCVFSDFSHTDGGADVEDCTMKLVQLQHRLWDWSADASRFIAAVIRDAHPDMTQSAYGANSPDIWGLIEMSGPAQLAPAGFIRQSEGAATEEEGEARGIREICPIPAERLPDAALRETEYAPYTKWEGISDEQATSLFRHYQYWRFLEEGPRPWQPGDGWLPSNAYLPREDSSCLGTSVVGWGLRSKR